MSETPDAQKGGMVREGSFSAKPAEAFPLKKIFPRGQGAAGGREPAASAAEALKMTRRGTSA